MLRRRPSIDGPGKTAGRRKAAYLRGLGTPVKPGERGVPAAPIASPLVVPPSLSRGHHERSGVPYRVHTASTSAASFGTPAVRFSCPFSVTRTSSSIRIPTPRISAGAASSSAAT